MARTTVEPRLITDDIEEYYATNPTEPHWAPSICVPIYAVIQWALKFNIDMFAGHSQEDYSPDGASPP